MRVRRLLLVAAAAGLAVVPGAAPAPAPQLVGTVGPGFTIVLEDAAGRTVTRLDPGTYVLEVRDRSPDHNFHLFGPGVNEATSVEGEGTVTWTVTLREGRYTAVCDPHPGEMRLALTVGNPPPEPSPAPTPTPKPKPTSTVSRLHATVGPGDAISLKTAAGRPVRRVAPGPYAVVVRDRSTRHGFHLVGKGVDRRTTGPFTGTVTWRVRLAAGPLRFFSDRSPAKVKGLARVG
jgi:hypothetical protein